MHDQQSWLRTPLGQYLIEQERALFDSTVTNIFGFNAVQLGMTETELLHHCRMPFLLRAGVKGGRLHCQSTQLPFHTASLDLLLLPHVLEFSDDPHQTLREAERALVPEGHLIISGFNPLSAWGLRRMSAQSQGYPWQGTFFSLPRIKDWLALLDFEITNVEMICYALPFSNPAWRKRCDFMDRIGSKWWPMMGGVYFIVAKKRVLGVRVIRPEWKQHRLNSLVTAPTQKQPSQQEQYQEEHE